jgi:hypothetical protein
LKRYCKIRVLDHLKSTAAVRACLTVTLLLALSQLASAQTFGLKDPAATNSDAFPFLSEVFRLYAHETSYHLESIEETTLNGQFSRRWNKSLTTAIVREGNQFRFEIQGEQGRVLQVSDGETEWVYDPSFQQYIQHPTPSTGPSDVRAPGPSICDQRPEASMSTKYGMPWSGKWPSTSALAWRFGQGSSCLLQNSSPFLGFSSSSMLSKTSPFLEPSW